LEPFPSRRNQKKREIGSWEKKKGGGGIAFSSKFSHFHPSFFFSKHRWKNLKSGVSSNIFIPPAPKIKKRRISGPNGKNDEKRSAYEKITKESQHQNGKSNESIDDYIPEGDLDCLPFEEQRRPQQIGEEVDD